MAEYINRAELIENLNKFAPEHFSNLIKTLIEKQPVADVVEVKHGEWIDKPTGRYCHIGSYCSVCEEKSGIGGIESNRHKPYCPNCGARMDGIPKERGGEK